MFLLLVALILMILFIILKTKKKFLITLVTFTILCVWTINVLLDPKSPGKDTAVYLGDGTFQVFRRSTTAGDGHHYDLYNVVDNKWFGLVFKYRIVKAKDTVYALVKDQPDDTDYQYFVLNYKNGKNYKKKTLTELEQDDKKIFEQISQFEQLN